MIVFNSLGSNYTARFVLQALITSNKKQYADKLIHCLEKKYKGTVMLLYKAREAITLALRLLSLPKSSFVAINGFTCYAVYEAIIKAGYIPYYLDIDDSLNFSSTTLEKAFIQNPSIKAVIIQNTFGIPCDIEKISILCKQNNCFLIEDLAHSAGALYANGKKAGTIGDCAIFSFSMDKIVDAVSGGALIMRKKIPKSSYYFETVPYIQQIKDRLYPLFTFLIRQTYSFGFGKIVHALLKHTRLLSVPMYSLSQKSLQSLPLWHCYRVYEEIAQLANNMRRRKKIAAIYAEKINRSLQLKKKTDSISQSTNLRFPLFTEKRQNLIAYLRKNNVYVSDIWYDAPIAPKKCAKKTNYVNQCPNAEKIANRIINLPTHRNISEEHALYIAGLVNTWHASL